MKHLKAWWGRVRERRDWKELAQARKIEIETLEDEARAARGAWEMQRDKIRQLECDYHNQNAYFTTQQRAVSTLLREGIAMLDPNAAFHSIIAYAEARAWCDRARAELREDYYGCRDNASLGPKQIIFKVPD